MVYPATAAHIIKLRRERLLTSVKLLPPCYQPTLPHDEPENRSESCRKQAPVRLERAPPFTFQLRRAGRRLMIAAFHTKKKLRPHFIRFRPGRCVTVAQNVEQGRDPTVRCNDGKFSAMIDAFRNGCCIFFLFRYSHSLSLFLGTRNSELVDGRNP